MQFLLIISHDDAFAPTEGLVSEIHEWVAGMQARGIRRDGHPLRPASEATTVRVRNGSVARTPGPFAPAAPEQMCAYELLECASMEDALAAASTHPMARAATIEVRQVWSALAES